MAKSSNQGGEAKVGRTGSQFRDPKFIIRVILGILVAANLVAGGSICFLLEDRPRTWSVSWRAFECR